ncbi:MAG TPA: type II toxin-antitoxin system HicA family toxin [Bradyrhizobium sp.]|uniref:type II toxin-antitoxin system HicA family toxin n=1 Tax=Bradyrhizobium sp. TaxID=376 RepID=UPI002BE474E5|nr:type II toxin-antitoxin system HicA family toxin [Bradyrhizobium sp.]HTB00006.1 type II toxin-antitoxin system HicA family toxin [Bradyrhizobium sp.]
MHDAASSQRAPASRGGVRACEGWTRLRVTGFHHVFKGPISGATVVVPHPKKDSGKGLVRAIYKGAGWKPD